MNEIPVEVGRVVVSKCGRDEGRLFLVMSEVDESFVMIADGRTQARVQAEKEAQKAPESNQDARSEHARETPRGRDPEGLRTRRVPFEGGGIKLVKVRCN